MAYIVIGKGQAGSWSVDASAVTRGDADLIEAARIGNLFKVANHHGVCSRDGALLDDTWLLVVTAPPETLNNDPAVIAYCDAP